MSNGDLFDEMENRSEDPSADFADWWEPEDPGDELVGVIVEMHSEPEKWTEPGEVPGTIYTVLSVGRGDVEEGKPVTPKQHKQLLRALEGCSLGDLVRIEFTGYQKVENQPSPMNTYEIGVMEEEEWQEFEGADDIRALLDDYDGVSGDNRRNEPYSDGGRSGPAAASAGGSSGSGVSSEMADLAQELKELVAIQGGAVDLETADRVMNEIRGHGADVEEVAVVAGLDVSDGVIS